MKYSLPILNLYFKAAWSLTAVIAFTAMGTTAFFHPASLVFVTGSYLLLTFQAIILAFRLQPIDALLITSGVTAGRRMAFMFAGWGIHMGLVTLAFVGCLFIAKNPGATSFQIPFPGTELHEIQFQSTGFLALVVFYTVILWVDFQARRLAGMGPFDSMILMLAGQAFVFHILFQIGTFLAPLNPYRLADENLFYASAIPQALIAIFILTRLAATYSLLKESEAI